jgi:hypothetical protein
VKKLGREGEEEDCQIKRKEDRKRREIKADR